MNSMKARQCLFKIRSPQVVLLHTQYIEHCIYYLGIELSEDLIKSHNSIDYQSLMMLQECYNHRNTESIQLQNILHAITCTLYSQITSGTNISD